VAPSAAPLDLDFARILKPLEDADGGTLLYSRHVGDAVQARPALPGVVAVVGKR